jgi:hypothetical protein
MLRFLITLTFIELLALICISLLLGILIGSHKSEISENTRVWEGFKVAMECKEVSKDRFLCSDGITYFNPN